MGVLQLLAPDQSTVLWDFDDSTGAANPSTVITDLGARLDLGTISPNLSMFSNDFGASLLGATHPPVEVNIGMKASAATDDALWTGLGQLARYLTSVSVDHPLYLKWNELTEVRYMDLIGALDLPQLLRGQTEGALAALRKNSMGPIPIRLLRQPWMRGPQVTSSSVTVPGDPATSTKVRVFPLTVTGDLPTPGKVQVKMDTGSTVQEVLIASRAQKSKASSVFADYLSDTGFFQCESTNRTWTITLGTNTTSTADANASGGNMARCTHATDPTAYNRRVRATRTTKVDSLRGAWDVWLRCKAAAARDYRVQLRWGLGTADPVAFTNDEVVHDTSLDGTPAAFGYVELNLGRIYIPEQAALGGLALEIWTRQGSGTAQNLDMDLLWLAPPASAVVVSGGSFESWLGATFATPVSNPAGGTAGAVFSNAIRLDTTTDNVGVTPNTGMVWGVGRHRVTFDVWPDIGAAGATVKLLVRNITDSTDAVSKTITLGTTAVHSVVTLAFDGVAGKAYQPQIDDPSAVTVFVESVAHEQIPYLGLNDSARTDPLRYAVDRLDSSNNLSGFLALEGDVPAMLDPGPNHIFIRADEIPLTGYQEPENKLARTPTVTVVYDPRYAL